MIILSPRVGMLLIILVMTLVLYGGHRIYAFAEGQDVMEEPWFDAPSIMTKEELMIREATTSGEESNSSLTTVRQRIPNTVPPSKIPTTKATTMNNAAEIPLWETKLLSPYLPAWMKDYFVWHAQQRQAWNASNWESYRYLIMTCRDGDRCGGTADRLRPFLALLRLASDTNRIFLIHWDRHNPAHLEEFLVPPRGGLDWRVPTWMLEKLQLHKTIPDGNLKGIIPKAKGTRKHKVLTTRYQSPNYGSMYYDMTINATNKSELFMNETFGYAWRVLFTPVLPIAQRVQDLLDEFQLVPGHYTGVHVRTYSIEPGQNQASKNEQNSTMELWHRMVYNSVRCGSELQQESRSGGDSSSEPTLLYFASDARNASRWAIDYGTINNVTVKARLPDPDVISSQVVHLGFAASSETNTTDAIAALYDIFVDLYLLSMGQCVTWGGGGFGQWAYLLSRAYASSLGPCGFRHGKRGKDCSWDRNATAFELPDRVGRTNDTDPLFFPPNMDPSQ